MTFVLDATFKVSLVVFAGLALAIALRDGLVIFDGPAGTADPAALVVR